MSSKATADHSAELLSSLGPIKQRAMFGGYGLYAEGVIIGLVVFDRLFLKTDAVSRPHFIAAACLPFTYEGKGKTVVVSYYEPPADAFDSSTAMQPWARLAIEAALRSANVKPKKASALPSAKKPAKSAK
jgi:DNA transformation protein and related proteins